MILKKTILTLLLILSFLPVHSKIKKGSVQKKDSSFNYFDHPTTKKAGALLLGASMAAVSETLISSLAENNGFIRLMARLLCATGSTLLLRTIKKSETFFDFFGIGYDSVVIGNIVRILALELKKGSFPIDNLVDIITLLSGVMDIRSKLTSQIIQKENTLYSIKLSFN